MLGAACAATGATIQDAYWGISDYVGASSTFDINNTNGTLSADTSDSYVKISGLTDANSVIYFSQNELTATSAYTLTFVLDVSKLQSSSTLFYDFSDKSGTSASAKFYGLATNADNKLVTTWNDSARTSNQFTPFSLETLNDTDYAVITLSTGSSGAYVYMNGEEAGTDSGLKGSGSPIEIYINSVNTAAIKSVYLHNSSLTSTDVSTLHAEIAQMIPEPTTATLSLLALAGLAARRRRK